jgi:hypothetical protein
MPNADIDASPVAPLTSSVERGWCFSYVLDRHWQLISGCNTSNVRRDDVAVEETGREPVTSHSSVEWGQTRSNPDSYLRRSRPEIAMPQSI